MNNLLILLIIIAVLSLVWIYDNKDSVVNSITELYSYNKNEFRPSLENIACAEIHRANGEVEPLGCVLA
jgi:hypothetical protein